MEPTVKLISWTQKPIQTIYSLWEQSKTNKPVIELNDINPTDKEVLKVFEGVINSHIPLSDFLNFVFILEDISISFREQMVRHKIGMKFGDGIGVDIIPNLSDSSFWGQSMRILDMGNFVDEERFQIPKSIEGCNNSIPWGNSETNAEYVYKNCMQEIQSHYRALVNAGVPMEDARNLIPLGATHRFSWTLNLTALKHVIGKRSCWIPQMGLWEPIIMGMIDQLCEKVHPVFRNLVQPPCISNGKFKDCVYKIDNERRISREDETMPCPLYMNLPSTTADIEFWLDNEDFRKRAKKYMKFWNKNPWTWENL